MHSPLDDSVSGFGTNEEKENRLGLMVVLMVAVGLIIMNEIGNQKIWCSEYSRFQHLSIAIAVRVIVSPTSACEREVGPSHAAVTNRATEHSAASVTVTLSHCHSHCHSVTLSQSQSHCHTVTVMSQCHKVTAELSDCTCHMSHVTCEEDEAPVVV